MDFRGGEVQEYFEFTNGARHLREGRKLLSHYAEYALPCIRRGVHGTLPGGGGGDSVLSEETGDGVAEEDRVLLLLLFWNRTNRWFEFMFRVYEKKTREIHLA